MRHAILAVAAAVAAWFGFVGGMRIAGVWLGVIMAINAAVFAALVVSWFLGRRR